MIQFVYYTCGLMHVHSVNIQEQMKKQTFVNKTCNHRANSNEEVIHMCVDVLAIEENSVNCSAN